MHIVKFLWVGRALIYKLFLRRVGNFSYMGKPCFIEGGRNISIGNRTRIFPGIRMEAIGEGKINIGNNCAIEQNVHIISEGTFLRIGDDATISANCFITNTDHCYEDISKSVMEQRHLLQETEIGDGCFLGYGTAIQAGTKLGKHCIVGAHSVVRGTYDDYCVIVGAPAKVIKKYNLEKDVWEKYTHDY